MNYFLEVLTSTIASLSFPELLLPLSSVTGEGGSGIIQNRNKKTLVPVDKLRVRERCSYCSWIDKPPRETAQHSSHSIRPQPLLRPQSSGKMSGNETVFSTANQICRFLLFDQGLSFLTAGQGNEDSNNEIAIVWCFWACAKLLQVLFIGRDFVRCQPVLLFVCLRAKTDFS